MTPAHLLPSQLARNPILHELQSDYEFVCRQLLRSRAGDDSAHLIRSAR